MEIDKRTKYFKMKEVLLQFNKGTILSISELNSLIATYTSSHPKSMVETLRMMGMTGLIKDIGDSRFEVL